jgi:GAF domain-containing protein
MTGAANDPREGHDRGFSQAARVLGPFQGKVACARIPVGRGVCGTCAATLEAQIVPDVHAFPGHIACDSASKAELVLPVVAAGRLVAVFDLDSPSPGRFDADDVSGVQVMLATLIEGTDWPVRGEAVTGWMGRP